MSGMNQSVNNITSVDTSNFQAIEIIGGIGEDETPGNTTEGKTYTTTGYN